MKAGSKGTTLAVMSRGVVQTKKGAMRKTAAWVGGDAGAATLGSTPAQSISQSPLFYDYRYSTPDKFYFPRDRAMANSIWRDIYRRDATVAIATDMYSELPWSKFTLEGIDDGSIRKLYEDMFNALNLVPKFTPFTKDYLITGELILHAMFNTSKGYWQKVVSHNPDYIRVVGTGLAFDQPLMWMKATPEIKRLLASADPRIRKVVDILPRDMVNAFRGNREVPLEPLNTTFLPRLNTSQEVRGTSIYTRLFRVNMYEDFTVNCSLAVSQRNAAPVRLIKVGDPNPGGWKPSSSDLESLAEMFSLAESDPFAAILTHPWVTVEYVGVSDKALLISREWDFIERVKLLALGVAKAFLVGETSFACFERGTPVHLANGAPVPIESIAVGDSVLDHTGKPAKVTNMWCEGVPEKLLEIRAWGGRKFRVTHNHRFPAWIAHSTNTLSEGHNTVRADQLQKDDCLKIPVAFHTNTDEESGPKVWRDEEYMYIPITSVQEVSNVEPVYNLEVEGNHTYLVCDGLATHNSAVAGLQTLLQRLASMREMFEQEWMIRKLCEPIAKMHEFYERPKSQLEHRIRVERPEDRRLIVPKIKWSKSLDSTQDANILNIWQALNEKGIISDRTLASGAGVDLEVERRNRDEEQEYKEQHPAPVEAPAEAMGPPGASFRPNPYRQMPKARQVERVKTASLSTDQLQTLARVERIFAGDSDLLTGDRS